MKTIGITGAAFLAALLGITAPAYAGQDHPSERQDNSKPQQSSHEQARPQQQHGQQPRQAYQQPGQDQSRPQQHAQQTQHAQHHEQSQQAGHAQQQDRYGQQQRSPQERGNGQFQRSPEQQRAEQSAWQQRRADNWRSDHRGWQQRGGYDGYRVPDYRFRGYFGAGHRFRIGGLPFMVVGGYPRFQYGGYWLSVVDPWPAYWGNDWYDNDDVYVSYVDNGYYLYNRRHPGVGIAISISM